jgi:short chain dehydrogenase
VNNAGAAWGAAFADFPEAGWDKVVDLNMKTPFFLTQALHKDLLAGAASGHAAKVINTAIAPGAFASDMNRDARDHADTVAQRIPIGRTRIYSRESCERINPKNQKKATRRWLFKL